MARQVNLMRLSFLLSSHPASPSKGKIFGLAKEQVSKVHTHAGSHSFTKKLLCCCSPVRLPPKKSESSRSVKKISWCCFRVPLHDTALLSTKNTLPFLSSPSVWKYKIKGLHTLFRGKFQGIQFLWIKFRLFASYTCQCIGIWERDILLRNLLAFHEIRQKLHVCYVNVEEALGENWQSEIYPRVPGKVHSLE